MKLTSNAKLLALVVGIVFLLLGILGFILNPTGGTLFGIFEVGAFNNSLYLVTGLLGLGAYYFSTYSRLYAQVVGIVYLLLGILAFISALTPGGALFGLMSVNLADNILHLVIGVVAAYVGFSKQAASTTN